MTPVHWNMISMKAMLTYISSDDVEVFKLSEYGSIFSRNIKNKEKALVFVVFSQAPVLTRFFAIASWDLNNSWDFIFFIC